MWNDLDRLQEECAEVIQVVSKFKKHGPESCHPDYPDYTNKERLEDEIADILVSVTLLVSKGVIDPERIQMAYKNKVCKIMAKEIVATLFLEHENQG